MIPLTSRKLEQQKQKTLAIQELTLIRLHFEMSQLVQLFETLKRDRAASPAFAGFRFRGSVRNNLQKHQLSGISLSFLASPPERNLCPVIQTSENRLSNLFFGQVPEMSQVEGKLCMIVSSKHRMREAALSRISLQFDYTVV